MFFMFYLSSREYKLSEFIIYKVDMRLKSIKDTCFHCICFKSSTVKLSKDLGNSRYFCSSENMW